MVASRTLWLLLLSIVLFFFALGNHQLQSSTEPRVAGIAMEMLLSDNWVTPTLSAQPFLEKPPLSVWLDAAAIRAFGAETWAVRLASAFAGLFSVLLLYGMLKRMARPVPVAWLGAFILATMASFWDNSRQVGEDALLAFGVTLALLVYFQAVNQRAKGDRSVWLWCSFAAGIAISTLSKGVLGLALPGVVIFAWLLCETLQRKRLVLADWLRPAVFTVLGLVPLMVWLCFLYEQGGVESLKAVLWTNSVGRFSGSFREAGHYEPFYYYIAKLPEAFMPWNLLVYLGLWHFRKQLLANRYLLFFSLWLIAQFVLLTLASSKRMVYLMSSAPAAAVIAAEYASVLWARLNAHSGTSSTAAFVVRNQRALMTAAVALVMALYLSAAVWLVPQEDRQFSFLPLTDRVHALQAEGHHVALFQPSERLSGASAFYTRSLLDAFDTDASVNAFLMSDPGNIAIMERTYGPALPLKAVADVKIGSRHYYFVRYEAPAKSN